jgi:YebC/PmpR family DNA-binding regulatory protein
MSGHSHFAQIHRQKGLNDAKKGNLFSKLGRAISIAVKVGGDSPDSNLKLKVAIEKARAASMPKENVERAIAKGSGGGEALEEIVYEGFGPSGVSVIVETATDNKNRMAQEIKNIFERAGGSLAGPGAVLFNFEHKGFIFIGKTSDPENQMLKLIDLGVEDVTESESGIEVYTAPDKLSDVRRAIEAAGFEIIETELQMKPINLISIENPSEHDKVMKFLEDLSEHDDVQRVYANV